MLDIRLKGKERWWRVWIKNIMFRDIIPQLDPAREFTSNPPRPLAEDPPARVKFEILFASFFTVLRFINTTALEVGAIVSRGGTGGGGGVRPETKGLSYFRATGDKSLNLVYKQIPQYPV